MNKIAKYKDKEYQFKSFMRFYSANSIENDLSHIQNLVLVAGNYKNLEQTSIMKLYLSARSNNILLRNHISTVGDLSKCSWWTLCNFRNCGTKSLQEIVAAMIMLGFNYVDATSKPVYIGNQACYQVPQTGNSIQNIQSNNIPTNNVTEATIDDVPEKYKKYVAKGIAEEVKDTLQNTTFNQLITTRLINKLIENKQQSNVLIYNKSQLPKVKVTKNNINTKIKIRRILQSLKENVVLIYDLKQDFIVAHQDYLCDIVFNSNLSLKCKRQLLRFIEEQCNTFNK